jgi:hypothetical protein
VSHRWRSDVLWKTHCYEYGAPMERRDKTKNESCGLSLFPQILDGRAVEDPWGTPSGGFAISGARGPYRGTTHAEEITQSRQIYPARLS